jgi:hypothetical protein
MIAQCMAGLGVFRKSCLTGLNPLIFRSRNGDLHKILIAPQGLGYGGGIHLTMTDIAYHPRCKN